MPKKTRDDRFSLEERRLTDREQEVLPYSEEEIEDMYNHLWASPDVKRVVMDVMNCSRSTYYKSYSHRFTYRAQSRQLRYEDGEKKVVPSDFKIPAGAALKQLARIIIEGHQGPPLRR
jgi:hypothetical protein